jgi:hypothetical protein
MEGTKWRVPNGGYQAFSRRAFVKKLTVRSPHKKVVVKKLQQFVHQKESTPRKLLLHHCWMEDRGETGLSGSLKDTRDPVDL